MCSTLTEGVLNLSCAMDSFVSLVKPTDLFSEKCVLMRKIEIARLIEVDKQTFLLSTYIIERKAKFKLEMSENKSVLFPVQVHGPSEIYAVRGPQVKNVRLSVRNRMNIHKLTKV